MPRGRCSLCPGLLGGLAVLRKHGPDLLLPSAADLTGLQVVHGSQWWVLSSEAALHLVTDASFKHLWTYLKHTHIPDETFFHTALLNTPHLAARTHPGAFRLIGKRAEFRTVTFEDVPRLLECRALFARKFASVESARNLTQASQQHC